MIKSPNEPSQKVIHLPALPQLGNDGLPDAKAVVQNRLYIGDALAGAGYYVPDLFPSPLWLKNYDARAKEVSGFLFPPLSAGMAAGGPGQRTAVRAQRFFEFVSALTSIHVGDRTAYDREGISKPCVVIDGEGEWEMVIELLHDLHAKGAFSSDVKQIVGYIDGRNKPAEQAIDAAVSELKARFAKADGKKLRSVHADYPDTHFFESFRHDIVRSEFGVVAFCSATMSEPKYIEAAERFAQACGEMGVRLITGAGKNSMMGAFDRGFKVGKDIFNKKHPNAPEKPAHIGISTNPVLRLEGPPPHLDQLIVLDNRYQRLRAFFDGRGDADKNRRASRAAKVACVFPGGIGTLEEFTTMLQLKIHGEMMEGIAIKLCNVHGYYDKLIDVCQKLGVESLFETYDTPEAMVESVRHIYQSYLESRPELLKSLRTRSGSPSMDTWKL